MSQSPVVEMSDISIAFPGVKALDSVDFRLLPGEVHALMGENGAGKSTLIKALTGVYDIDSGTIVVEGKQVRLTGTADAQDAGISTVYQEVNLLSNLTVGENVMLGHEVRGPFGIKWRATHAEARKALDDMGLTQIDTHLPLSQLSIALQQLVAISRAMVTEANVLILDEPTSSLDSNEVEMLFAVIRRLRDDGVAILFVSHFLDQVYEISDRMTVLRNGEQVGEYVTAELERTELISVMIGKDLATLDAIGSGRQTSKERADAPMVLEAEGLGRKGSVFPTDFKIRRGEVVGIAGLLGSGRTELARLLYGADRADTGSLKMHGENVELKSPAAGLKNKIAYSSENRRDEGIVADLSVRQNLILALQARRGWARPISRKEQDELVQKYLVPLDVRPSDPERLIKNLSGGNQQKVLLGRWLATQPELLILDEPTRGIDIGAKAEIEKAVVELAHDGVSIVFISSEIEEVARVSDRIVVMKDRSKLTELENGSELSAAKIVSVIAAKEETA